jgi:hypothetical protein
MLEGKLISIVWLGLAPHIGNEQITKTALPAADRTW